MYPLDAVYGPAAYLEFERHKALRAMKSTLQDWEAVNNAASIEVDSYAKLVDVVSFLSVMNKRLTLHFRGQAENWPLRSAIFRPTWRSLSGTHHTLPADEDTRGKIWNHLNGPISKIVHSVCDNLPMPRPNTLRMFREAVWAVAQHYDLWPTPLIDVTPSLRVAASFALWNGQGTGYLYVVALVPSTNSVTFDADQHIVLARLQAVCPPVAKRPHYQDGFLAGRFPFVSPVSNMVDSDPDYFSRLNRRLIARIHLNDAAAGAKLPIPGGFWSADFPIMSARSLMPSEEDDQVLSAFAKCSDKIDKAMSQICQG
ncbi:FRG domain-containing protein [Bradyrhizobium lablabi]|uniref:FRG domain-containing protein n=1 Tax=Bradyrhizobium lablabi TaxID=722472 RepID=UPI001BAC71BB|nr:FRG domain-containing protein [Bradyrhizobium lablabi]MBR1122314.1 FRG domain-containing protein [Bradyrhizobium lablabi]